MEGNSRQTESLRYFGSLLKDLRKWSRETLPSIIEGDTLRGFIALRSEMKRFVDRCPELQKEIVEIIKAANKKKRREIEPRIDRLRKEAIKEVAEQSRRELNIDILAGRKKSSKPQKLSQEITIRRIKDEFDWLLDCGDLREFARQFLRLENLLENQ
jgi:hypothetical protein